MGQIIIETPLKTSFSYRIQDTDVAKTVIKELNDVALKVKESKKPGKPVIEPPTISRKEALEAAFGLWADREETGEEIARKIRDANRKVT